MFQDQGLHPNLVLASFETSALELLFPFPQVILVENLSQYSSFIFYLPHPLLYDLVNPRFRLKIMLRFEDRTVPELI